MNCNPIVILDTENVMDRPNQAIHYLRAAFEVRTDITTFIDLANDLLKTFSVQEWFSFMYHCPFETITIHHYNYVMQFSIAMDCPMPQMLKDKLNRDKNKLVSYRSWRDSLNNQANS